MGSRRQTTQPKSADSAVLAFPPEGIRFLRDLKKNNNRDWFRERKDEYVKIVEEPMKNIVLAVSAECNSHGLPLFPKDKSPVMRVYRDIRFSKDKRPYKTHVAAELRRGFNVDSWGGLYLHISPDQSFVASGFWEPERSTLLPWREALIKNPKEFEEMHRALVNEGLDFSSEYALSSMPRGFANYADQPFAKWLKLTSFILSQALKPADYTAPSFVQNVVAFALASRPLLEYGWKMEDANPQATRKPAAEHDFL